MNDPVSVALFGASLVAALSIASVALLKAWRGWLELKQLEINRRDGAPVAKAAGRIEIADLRERVRKLEAIAAGIDV